MKRMMITAAIVTVALFSGWLKADQAGAVSMADYASTPPFIADTVPPNVLILMDNSGSMSNRACEAAACGILAGGGTSTTTTFTATTSYTGFFDNLSCYTYDSATGNKRFSKGTAKSAVSTACPDTEWDGNLLNWLTFRRFDAVKKAMIGGDCAVNPRNADGTCPTSGSPAKIVIQAQTKFDGSDAGFETIGVTSSGSNSVVGRVPVTVAKGGLSSYPSTLYFYVRGGTAGMQGTFCVDNDSTAPATSATSCSDKDSSAFNESQYSIRIVMDSEPKGVIQQVGAKARFGLLEFKGAGDGGRVLTGIGLRQSINFDSSTVETFNDNTAAMIDAIEESFPSTWTPLAESLYDGVRYIAQVNSTFVTSSYTYPIAFAGGASNGANFQTAGVGSVGTSEITALTGSETCPSGYIASACGRDPYFYGSNHTPAWSTTSATVTCCKTFVIIFTDGEPTQDLNIPSALQDYAHAAHGLHCTGGSSTIHTPNGTCNTNNATPNSTLLGEHKTDYGSSGSHYLDDVAYWAHINDLRQSTIPVLGVAGHDLTGMQNVTLYTFFAFGNIAGREILMQAAKLGAFEDTNGNNLPDVTAEWDKVNNNTGVAGADGLPDTYFESSNVDDLEARLLAALTSILQRSSSGTSISVLATSATGDGSLYQAFFFPTTFDGLDQIKWTGYTQGLFVDEFGNFREDTNGDRRLVYAQDDIVQARYDTSTNDVKIDRYKDTNGDGIADSATPYATVSLREMAPIWEAGKQLASKAAVDRKLLTWVDSDNDGYVDSGERLAFSSANLTALSPYLRGDTTGTFTAANIVEFIRGTQVSGMRNRQLQVPPNSGTYKVWKLGDPIHATPTIVGAPRERFDVIYGDSSYTAFFQKYKNRRLVAYVGTNDGMLHAFNGGFYHRGDDTTTTSVTERGYFTKNATDDSSGAALGDEMWGFIPYQLLPHLRWLTQGDYTHVYYVDLKPKIAEVRIFADDATHPGGWGTILIGGFGMGGSCGVCTAGTGGPAMTVTADFGSGSNTTRTFYSAYFVLDITDPEQDPVLLWSFSQSNLGFSTGYPNVLRVKPSCTTDNCKVDNTDAKWFMTVGSGPTAFNGSSTQTSNIFAVDLKTGPVDASTGTSLVSSFDTGDANSFMGDTTTLDTQLDYRVDVVYAGNVIATGSTNPTWIGKLYRLTTNSGSVDPTSWGVLSGSARIPTVLMNTFPTDNSLKVGPVTAAPTVAADDAGRIWAFFGTGRFFGTSDKTNADTQYFFGVKDPVATAGCTQTSATNCAKNDLVNVSSITICSVCASGTNQVSGLSGVTSFSGTATSTLQGLVQSKDGWYTTLPTSRERAIITPTLIGGAIFFPTFTPSGDICSASGDGRLYALFYQTGSAYKASLVGTEAGTGGNTNVSKSISMGTGLSSQMAVHIGAQGVGKAGTAVAAGSSGGSGAGNSNSTGGSEGRISLISQSSTGASGKTSANAALTSWSRIVSWINQRD